MIYIIQQELLYQNKVISSLNSTCNHKMVYCVYQQKFYRCVPLSSFRSGFLIQDPLNHGALKRPLNPI